MVDAAIIRLLFLVAACYINATTSFFRQSFPHTRPTFRFATSFSSLAEFNDAIRSATSPAATLALLNLPNASPFVSNDTAFLIISALTSGGPPPVDWEAVESTLYVLRSTHALDATAAMWDQIIVAAARDDPNLGKKYFNRMLKHGPVTATLAVYEALVNAYSRVENWKEVTALYKNMRDLDEGGEAPVLANVGVGFYERALSYNARRGRWKEATYWMDELGRRGLPPSHKCYRLAIDACNKGGKAKDALCYIDAMLAAFADQGTIDEGPPGGGDE